jgi:CBS domain-containing protein
MQTLKSYKTNICKVANRSALAEYVPTQHRSYHLGFARLYKLVNDARNDALHQGAFARHLTNNATQLALVLEDALMNNSTSAADYMVREPVTASFWQPLSFIRQQMLANSFTYLPVFSTKGPPCWKLVSDYHIAVYLRTHNRKDRLAKTLEDAANEHLTLESAKTCNPDMPINKVLEISEGKPVLVVDQQNPDRLLGIITPFDLL